MSAKERELALAAGLLAFELSDWENDRFNLPVADLLDLSSGRDPAGAARSLRQHWSIGERPVGHMLRLREAKGIRVFSLAENTRNVDAFSCWRNGDPFIFLNTFKMTERSRFDAAHEFGHFVMHKHGGPQQGRKAEWEAQLFVDGAHKACRRDGPAGGPAGSTQKCARDRHACATWAAMALAGCVVWTEKS